MADELAGGDAQRHDLVEHLGQVLDHRGDAVGQRPGVGRRRRDDDVLPDGIHNSYEK